MSKLETVCCVCDRVRKGESWVTPARPVGGADCSHGYCPVCYRNAMKEVEIYLAGTPLTVSHVHFSHAMS